MTFAPLYDAVPLNEIKDPDDPSVEYALAVIPGTSVAELLNGDSTAAVYSGKTQVTSGNICTGMTLKAKGTTFALVVLGDTNGDGRITITDVVAIQSHVVGKKSLEGVYELAADINLDDKITVTDVVKAARIVVGKDSIDKIG